MPVRIPIPAVILVLASVSLLLGALFFQFVVGIEPCVLCLWQRWAHVAAAILATLALATAARPPRRHGALLAACGLALLAGFAIAVFNVGVEQHWWTGTPGCGVPAPAATLEELSAQLLAAPVARCDQVAWSLFGISLAGYNALVSLPLAVFAGVAARRALTTRS